MTALDPDIFDDPFHGSAWAAFADFMLEHGRPPESEEHRRRAYLIYEEERARKNDTKQQPERDYAESAD